MTRSSTNELYTPYKDLEQYSEEEEEEEMAETMEQYMSKTRIDYGSGVARPKIDNKDQFELKGQFLKELRENTFSDSDNEDANEHIEKVLEIVDLFHVLNITVDQLMLRVFPISLTRAASRWLRNEPTEPDETLFQAWEHFKELLMMIPPTLFETRYRKTAKDAKKAIQEMDEYSQKRHNRTSKGRNVKQCKGPHYTKDYPQKEEGKTLEEAYYTYFGGPFQGGGYRATTPKYYQRNNANPSYQERRQSMKDTMSKFMSESAKRHEENSNLIKEIRATTDAAIRNKGASIKTLEIQIGQISKERFKKTKRSRNDQKPTRNERDKNKSEETAKDQSRISPTQQERQSKVKGIKSKDQL
ncbi:hypothetical protein Tco_1037153 [Tanacetum coccineum]